MKSTSILKEAVMRLQDSSSRLHLNFMNDNKDFDSDYVELKKKYAAALPLRLQKIDELWRKLCQINWSPTGLEKLCNQVHQLAGSGKTFGFEQLGVHARELELQLAQLNESQLPPNVREKEIIASKIKTLTTASAEKDGSQKAHPVPLSEPMPGKLIFLVDDDSAQSDYLAALLNHWGYDTRTFNSLQAFYQELKIEIPDLVCLDIVFPEGKFAGIEAMVNIKLIAGRKIPTVFFSSRGDMVARLKALRSGGDGFLVKPIDAIVLKDTLADLLTEQANKVLIIDDDELIVSHLKNVLNQAGMQVDWISNPVETLNKLETFFPDLIILDYHIPHCNGLELARLLRQDERYIGISILFLSTEKNKEIQHLAHSISGNQFLQKPVNENELLENVRAVIERTKLFKSRLNLIRHQKAGTNVYTRSFFFSELEAAIASAGEENNQRFAFYVAIDKTDYLKQRLGWTGFSNLIERLGFFLASYSSPHIVTQLKDDLYLILSNPMQKEDADGFADDVCRDVALKDFTIDGAKISVTLSLGYTELTPRIKNIEQCLSEIQEGCVKANEQGGSQSVFWPRKDVKSHSTETGIEDSVESALLAKSFMLVFQPIVNLSKPEKYFETLVRLTDADGRVLLPNQFLPYVKEKKLQLDLDRWIIQKAINTLLSLGGHDGEEINLFIKITPEIYNFAQIVTYTTNELRRSKLKGDHRILMEVNESWAIKKQVQLNSDIQLINSVGIGMLIDKVGRSDYTTDLLEVVKPDFIRLDKALVESFQRDDSAEEKLKEIIELADQKDIKIIASAIEDASVFASLWDLGIRYFQGYFIQHPVETLDFDFDYLDY